MTALAMMVPLGFAASGASSRAAPAGVPIVVGRLVFEATNPEDRQKGMDFLDSLPGEPTILYLDLVIAPALTNPEAEEPTTDFMTTATGKDGKDLPSVPCALGASQMIDDQVSRLALNSGAIHPNVLLTIDIASGVAAPFNALSCDYAPSEAGQIALNVRGFFVVHEGSIPTARDIHLTPYLPPYEVAQQTIAALEARSR